MAQLIDGPYVQDGLLYNDGKAVADWVAQRVGLPHAGDRPIAIGIVDGRNRLIAGAWFFSLRPRDIEIAVACDDISAAVPDAIRRVLDYPFNQLGLDHVTAEIDHANRPCWRLAEGLGFRRYGTKPTGTNGGPVYIYGLTRETFKLGRL
jgi:hypothetical protein